MVIEIKTTSELIKGTNNNILVGKKERARSKKNPGDFATLSIERAWVALVLDRRKITIHENFGIPLVIYFFCSAKQIVNEHF